MADEIRVNVTLAVNNGNLKDSFAKSYTADQAAAGGPTPGYVTIGTSVEEVSLSELGTKGWCIIQNLDATNFVEWGFSTGVYGGKLLAGETAGPFRLNSTSLFLKSDTAACKVVIRGYEA